MGDRWIIPERFEFMLPLSPSRHRSRTRDHELDPVRVAFLNSLSLSLIWSSPRARRFCPNPPAQDLPQSWTSHYTFSRTHKALLVSSLQSTNRIQERWTAEVHLVRSRTEASVPVLALYAFRDQMYQPKERLQLETLLNGLNLIQHVLHANQIPCHPTPTTCLLL
jgi:hypothetical protein